MAKKKDSSRLNLKLIGIGVVVILAIIGVFLITRSNNSLGSQNTPYNSSFGYQGQGYYEYKGGVFYASSQNQFVSSLNRTGQQVGSITSNSSKSTITSELDSVYLTNRNYEYIATNNDTVVSQASNTTLEILNGSSVHYKTSTLTNPYPYPMELTNITLTPSSFSYTIQPILPITIPAYGNVSVTVGLKTPSQYKGNITEIVYLKLLRTNQPTTTIYQASNYGCSPLPCSYIKNGNFTFLFTLPNSSVEQWHFPVTAYNYWVSAPRVDPIIRLNDTITGKTIYTYDYRSTITPSFFANVTPQLTNGKTAGQFVAEVQDINSQLVNYSLVFSNTSIYSAQLLAQGQGDCKDKGVLMASILEAGNIQANYGMKIQFVYVDADNLTAPRTANHLMLYITYANGTKAFLDTTHVLATTPYFNGQVDGWYYNLTCTMSGCLSTPICTGAYCDEVGYTSGASGGFNYCSSGYVVTANNTCQAGCGDDYYCNSGSSCYNNQCDSCQEGYILGNDGQCHAECGNSGTYCTGTSSCYNGECLSCPSGYYLATNGECYQDSGYTSDPTTTIQSSGSGSCGSFELTESSPDTSTSGSARWRRAPSSRSTA